MILVTGASGLLGSHVLLNLLEKGETVRGLIRPNSNLGTVKSLFGWYGPEKAALLNKVNWAYGDLLDIPSLIEALKGVEKVFHCAGMISFDPADEKALFRTNWEGTRNLVDLCLDTDVNAFCFVSSVAALNNNSKPQTEIENEGPINSYGYAISKYMGEMEVWRASQEGLNVVIVNPGIIIGPGDFNKGSGRLFSLLHKGLKYCPPGGTGFIGVNDCAKAMIALVNTGAFEERFILVSDNLKYCDVLGRIARSINVKPPTRQIKSWQLEVLWRLDKIRFILGGKQRKLTRTSAKSLIREQTYNNEKIKNFIKLNFSDLDLEIANTGKWFVKNYRN
jgi:nucleoside-diphosphate-sugar epimerase